MDDPRDSMPHNPSSRVGDKAVKRASVIGTGLIGRSWAIVFARSGIATTLYDPVAANAHAALRHISDSLHALARHGLVDHPDEIMARIELAKDLATAIQHADWIQECAPETLESKRSLFSALDEGAKADALIASSTSGFRASAFTDHLDGRDRTLVAHPVNPPHLAPLVELAPAPWTSPETIERAIAFMRAIDQQPILVRKEIDGFVLNRLQGAVLDEAFSLVEDGHVSAEDLDKAMVYGLAPRWSFMGPFETIDLNAPGGLKDYAERYSGMYHRFATERSADARQWSAATVHAIDSDRRRALPAEKISERANWRDRLMMKLAAQRTNVFDEEEPSGRDTEPADRPVAMVTGGSRGIGRQACLALARRGYDIFLTYQSRADAANAVAEEAKALGVRCVVAQADSGDPASVEAVFDVFDRSFGRLDALVNNAGTTGPMSSLDKLDTADLQRVLNINVVGSFIAAKLAAQRMSTRNGGRGGVIVNLSSRAGKLGGANEWLHYAASKGAIDTFTIGLARELGPAGIRVNAVCPGLIATEIHAASGGGDRLEKLAGAVPQGRIGDAEEVAETIAWLVAEAPHYVTAASIDISGGR